MAARFSCTGGVTTACGAQEIGESIGACVAREVKEETGLDVVPEYVVGVYSNPHHVHVFDVCIACRLVGGKLAASEESYEVAFFSPEEIAQFDMRQSVRLRIAHYLQGNSAVVA